MMELQRCVVLLIALMNHVLDGTPADAGHDAIRRELEALTAVLVHRTRSMVDYAQSARGQAILELGKEALEGTPQGQDLTTAYRDLLARVAELEAPPPEIIV